MMSRKSFMILSKNMKFVIAITTTHYGAVELDRINGNTYWQGATKKEMKNVKVAFKFIDDGSKLPIGFKKIKFQGPVFISTISTTPPPQLRIPRISVQCHLVAVVEIYCAAQVWEGFRCL